MISLVLMGAEGRMGRAVEEAARGADDIRIKARVDLAAAGGAARSGPAPDRPVYGGHPATTVESPASVTSELGSTVAAGDVVIEFSSPAGTREAARVCGERGAALVSGTTGLSPEDEAALETAARRVPVLRAANFSLGIAALRRAVAAALEALPPEWDIEIVERHHRRKVDSPSGTALLLARDALEKRGYPADALRSGREGRGGPRTREEIGLHAVRGGSWVGDHAVLLAGEGESLELRHVAQDRSAFAHGAVAAARFVAQARPGLYTLDDVLDRRGRGN